MNGQITKEVVRAFGTIGTMCFLCMPYAFGTIYFLPLAVAGNILLLPQVWGAKQYNLVLLNVIGGSKYLYEFLLPYIW